MKKFVSVQFCNGKGVNPFENSYQFLTDITDLEENDYVVVDTANGIKIARVLSYDSSPKVRNLKWVVQRIDLTRHNERIEKEKKKLELKRKMNERRKALEEVQIFQLLAKEDEEMKEFLEEYNSLED